MGRLMAFLCPAQHRDGAGFQRDRFGSLLAAGLTMCSATQTDVNIAVTTCLLPNKGMPLPFISAGGSNLCFCLFALGLMVSILRASPVYHGEREPKKSRAPKPIPAAAAADP